MVGHIGYLLLEVALVLLQPLEHPFGVRDAPVAEAVAASPMSVSVLVHHSPPFS
jgi:hypothetical protein